MLAVTFLLLSPEGWALLHLPAWVRAELLGREAAGGHSAVPNVSGADLHGEPEGAAGCLGMFLCCCSGESSRDKEELWSKDDPLYGSCLEVLPSLPGGDGKPSALFLPHQRHSGTGGSACSAPSCRGVRGSRN